MLNHPTLRKIIIPSFQKQPDEILRLALENYQQINGPAIASFYQSKIEQDLLSSDKKKIAEALNVIVKLQSPSHSTSLLKLLNSIDDHAIASQIMLALGNDRRLLPTTYRSILYNTKLEFETRLSALATWCLKNEQQALKDLIKWLPAMSEKQTIQLITRLSHTKQGNQALLDLYEISYLKQRQWDYNAANRTLQFFKQDWRAKEIFATARAIETKDDLKRKQKVAHYSKTLKKLKGNLAVGKALFQSCLACHQVGKAGNQVAPPLDGSANRNIDHMLTAIVNPDEAVEGAYGLYSVVRKNGSYVEGILKKSSLKGTLIAQIGGIETFIPKSQILHQGGVNSRSFMPKVFGNFPDQSMADLVAYIKTLQ